jgi:hypothetical protein
VNNWKVILATMVIFGTGVVTGGLLVRHSEHIRPARNLPHPTNAARPQVPVTPGVMRVELLKRISRELDMSPDQHERIERILKDSQERTRRLMEPLAPDLRAEINRTREEFRAALTPPQQARFDELLRQQQRPKDRPHPANTNEKSGPL